MSSDPALPDLAAVRGAPAPGRPALWRLVAGTGLAVAGWMGAALLLLPRAEGPRAAILLFLLSFGGIVLGLWLAMRLLHRERLASLLGPGGLTARGLAAGVGAGFAAAALSGLVGGLIAPPGRGVAPDVWARFLPLALPLVVLQSAAEELLFRGYLMRGLAARFRSPLVWWLAPGLLFGALHWNPADFGPAAPAAVASATLLGLLLADVTLRTGSLSAAIGLHAANNLAALLLLAPASSLDALALLVQGPGPGPLAALDLATAVAGWGVWLAIRPQSGASMYPEPRTVWR